MGVESPNFRDAWRGAAISVLTAFDLRTEYKPNPLGIDARRPALMWKLRATGRGARQTAYHVQVASSRDALEAGEGLLWDTGRVESDRSVHVTYGGPPVESGRRYYWRVRVWDESGTPSSWSDPAFWEMGLLDVSEWSAEWITPDWNEDTSKPQPSPMLRTEFSTDGPVAAARAYVTSLGLYEVEINGRRVGDQLFTPGWTTYDERLQYQTYDVTDHLTDGENAVGIVLGDGWYRGNMTWDERRNVYGDRLAALVEIRITFEDGRVQVVASDDAWRASTGPIQYSDIYDGEAYDARLEKTGWSRPGYDDADWRGVRMLDHPKDILTAPAGPPVRRIEEITPVAVFETPGGDTVVDMGQNMVGWVRLHVDGPSGSTVTLRHAEVLDKNGNFYVENLRGADQTVRYTLKGGGDEEYEPHFTFQGFRYVAVDGYPGTLGLESLTGVVIHSDMPRTGYWASSDSLLNQLQHNIVWGQKGNFLDVPTDCPQRDERMGWTGDAQVFAPTAAFNFEVAGFFDKWLRDLAADQRPDGSVPFVVPDVLSKGSEEGPASAGWADAAVIVPWTVYLAYGDAPMLERQYPSMKAWVEYMRSQSTGHLWNSGFHFGDWLAFATDRADYPGATTGKDLIATAFFAHSSHLVSKAAAVLGEKEDAAEYEALFEEIKAAFNHEFVTPSGRVGPDTQTAYALALQFELLPVEKRAAAARRLVEDIRAHENHLTTGFLGTPYLCHVLSDNGHADVAFTLLNQQTYPSWLYPVRMGATTIWERWDGIKPDSTFQTAEMNSFNHYAYGAIGEWMYGVAAGIAIDPAQPGYKHIIFRPVPGGGLTSVDASHESLFGEVSASWRIEGDVFHFDVGVPPNAHATVRLPGAAGQPVTESGSALEGAGGVTGISTESNDLVVEIGAGAYRFAYGAHALPNRAGRLESNEGDARP